MHILIKSTLQPMISNIWLSVRRWLAYYSYLLAIYTMPDGKRRFRSYYELVRLKLSTTEHCKVQYLMNRQEYESLKSQDNFKELLQSYLGSSLIKGLFENNFVYVFDKEEPNGDIMFSAVVNALPSDVAYSAIITIFDEPHLTGWTPGTKHNNDNDKQDNSSVLSPSIRDILKQQLRTPRGIFK